MPRRGENIRKRKDGRWEARVIVARNADNKLKYKYLYGKSYKEVKELAKNFTQQIQPANESKTPIVTVNAHAYNWLSKVRETRKHSTYIKYLNIYEKHLSPSIGEKLTNEINEELLLILLKERYNSGKKTGVLSLSTIKAIRYVLFSMFSDLDAPALELITGSFYTKSNVNIEVFTETEQKKIITFLLENPDSYNIGILIAFYTGIRLGELCALQYSDIDFYSKTISIKRTVQRIKTSTSIKKTELRCSRPKSNASERTIPMSDELYDILACNLTKEKYIVNGSQFMEPRTYQYKFQRILKSLAIPEHSFHTIRHTFATNCVSNGMNIKCLSEILGHSDVKTTMNRYVHPTLDSKLYQINQCISYNNGQD